MRELFGKTEKETNETWIYADDLCVLSKAKQRTSIEVFYLMEFG
jgi:hypothetical protein